MKAQTKEQHYGDKLKAAIKEFGLKKIWVAKQLGYGRVWLDELIRTGKFPDDKLPIVKQIIRE